MSNTSGSQGLATIVNPGPVTITKVSGNGAGDGESDGAMMCDTGPVVHSQS